MKRYIANISIMLALILSAGTITYADTQNTSEQNDINVPVKYICEEKGGTVSWDKLNRTAMLEYKGKNLKLKIGSTSVISNGTDKLLGNNVTTSGGRTILPVSILNSELGLEVTNDDCLRILGVKFTELVKTGRFLEASALLSEPFSKYLNSSYISDLSKYFSMINFDSTKLSLDKNTVHQNLNIPFTSQQVDYNCTIRFDYSGRIDELNVSAVQPEIQYTRPVYDNTANYTEQQVTFGDGVWRLPATLTIPKGKGPFPVVILVHGSGASDRDESLGPLKPFRDIAVGLAQKNIAVLRYEKRTLEHSTKMKLIGNFTMIEEFEQDAYAAAEYLKSVEQIDSSNIILLGHSQGGYFLPKMLSDDKSETFKAGIIMSGCTRPIYQLILDQYEYLMGKGLVSKEQYEYLKGQTEMLNDSSFYAKNPPEGYTLGNEYYYNYMKNYDVLDIARALKKPMLVLQGERDYQVRADVDFSTWKKVFTGKQNVSFKLYEKLNHMYTEGEGDCLPSEYMISANIPQYVIDDIGAFVNKTAGR
jgi:predicted esterase